VVNTPVKLVMIKAGKLKILARGAGLTGVTLDETSQDQIAVHYQSGAGSKLCTEFSGGTIRANQPGAFIALNSAPPASCLPEPAGCTPCVPAAPALNDLNCRLFPSAPPCLAGGRGCGSRCSPRAAMRRG
jgi:hypothetical protein